jgi:hypothetical protein
MSQPTTWGCPRVTDAPVGPETVAARIDDSLDALLSSHSGATRPAYAVEGTIWYDTDTDDLYAYDGTADRQVAVKRAVPANASATGNPGWVSWDANYIYVCTAANTWKRVAIATWP